MNKTIEKAENKKREIINRRLDKLRIDYDEADDNYRVTGYDRYFNKMERCRKEILELEDWLERDNIIATYEHKCREVDNEIKEIRKNLSNKLFYLLHVVPDCSEAISLKLYLDELEKRS